MVEIEDGVPLPRARRARVADRVTVLAWRRSGPSSRPGAWVAGNLRIVPSRTRSYGYELCDGDDALGWHAHLFEAMNAAERVAATRKQGVPA